MNDIVCHELIHLATIDFFRTARLAAAENEEMQSELEYKFEQFTSRLQRAFSAANDKIEELEDIEDKFRQLKHLYLSEDFPEKWEEINKLFEHKKK